MIKFPIPFKVPRPRGTITHVPNTNLRPLIVRPQDLKYNPKSNASFMKFGILPFFQEKIDQWSYKGPGKPPIQQYTQTTTRQSEILAALGSDCSLLSYGNELTKDESILATLLHAFQLTLTRKPNLMFPELNEKVETVIVVPTDDILDKYAEWAMRLLSDIPPRCVPKTLVSSNKGEASTPTSNSTTTVERSPMVVDFSYDQKETRRITSDPDDVSTKPQIVITTLSELYNISEGLESKLKLAKSDLDALRFLCVVDTSAFLRCTDINGAQVIGKTKKKGRYVTRLIPTINRLQGWKNEGHYKRVYKSLKPIGNSKLPRNLAWGHDTDYTKMFLEDSWTPESDNYWQTELYESFTKEVDLMKLEQIQLCFLLTPDTPLKYEIGNQFILKEEKILEKARAKAYQRHKEDPLEMRRHFDDLKELLESQRRNLKSTQRKILKTVTMYVYEYGKLFEPRRDLYNSGKYEKLDSETKVSAYFTALNKKGVLEELELMHESSETSELIGLIHDFSKLGSNLRAAMNRYFVNKSKARANQQYVKIVSGIVDRLRVKNNNEAVLIVVPSRVNAKQLAKTLNSSKEEYTCTELNVAKSTSDGDAEKKNVIMNTWELFGKDVDGFSNLVVVDLDSLSYQTALSNMGEEAKELITGIEDPFADLLEFYVSKLISSKVENTNKNIIFGLFEDRNDYERMIHIFKLNDISNAVSIERFIT